MLVIEGTDCMGKTTLARSIWSHPQIQALGMEIQHLSRLPLGHDRLWHYINRMNINGIFDRFWISELAYAAARGDAEILLTPERLKLVQAAASLNCCMTVLIVAEDPVVVSSNWNKDEMYSRELVLSANAHFKRLEHYADFVIRRFKADDYVDTTTIESLVEAYLARRAAFSSLSAQAPGLCALRRRPSSLVDL